MDCKVKNNQLIKLIIAFLAVVYIIVCLSCCTSISLEEPKKEPAPQLVKETVRFIHNEQPYKSDEEFIEYATERANYFYSNIERIKFVRGTILPGTEIIRYAVIYLK